MEQDGMDLYAVEYDLASRIQTEAAAKRNGWGDGPDDRGRVNREVQTVN